MNGTVSQPKNPLARLARGCPAVAGWPLALGALGAGSVVMMALFLDESYERTRALAVVVGVLALLSCLSAPARWRGRVRWVGAGALFFGGALLAQTTAGLLALCCGIIAAVALLIDEQRDGRRTDVPAFFIAFAVIAAAVSAIVLLIEG